MADTPDHPHYRLMIDLMKQADSTDEIPLEEAVAHWLEKEEIDTNSVHTWTVERAELATRFFRPVLNDGQWNIDPEVLTAVFGAMLMDGIRLGYDFALARTDRP